MSDKIHPRVTDIGFCKSGRIHFLCNASSTSHASHGIAKKTTGIKYGAG